MLTIRIEPHVFSVLRSGFEAGANDEAPLDQRLLGRLWAALIEADADSTPGLPVLLMLGSAVELDAMASCFEVGAETDPSITDDQWLSVLTLFESASRPFWASDSSRP